jgi:hypothetical protein
MNLSVEELRRAVELAGDAVGAEAEIVAQFVLDLAIAASLSNRGGLLPLDEAQRLLRLRLARHRTAIGGPASRAIH